MSLKIYLIRKELPYPTLHARQHQSLYFLKDDFITHLFPQRKENSYEVNFLNWRNNKSN